MGILAAAGRLEARPGERLVLKRARFVLQSLLHHGAFRRLTDPGGPVLLAHMIDRRPEFLSSIMCGRYLAAPWGVDRRVQEFTDHVRCLERIGPSVAFDLDEAVVLGTLDVDGSTYHVVVDKSIWFHREGVLTINLAKGLHRLYTLAFSFSDEGGRLSALIGAIQGRRGSTTSDDIRTLTKWAHGIRPRDLLIEIFRAYCRAYGVFKILAVTDRARPSRRTFGRDPASVDYDEIWRDRGGVSLNATFTELPLIAPRRTAEEIPAKKRSMYRKRYAFLDEIGAMVARGLANARPQRFDLV